MKTILKYIGLSLLSGLVLFLLFALRGSDNTGINPILIAMTPVLTFIELLYLHKSLTPKQKPKEV